MSSDRNDHPNEKIEAESDRFVNKDGTIDEQALLVACRRGDCEALSFLFSRYRPAVVAGAAQAWMSSPHVSCDLSDLVQDIFLRIIEAPQRLLSSDDRVHDLHTWLQTVAYRMSINLLKSHDVNWPPAGVVQESSQLDAVPDRRAGSITQERSLFQAIAGLSDASRRIMELSFGYPYGGEPSSIREIAEQLGMTPDQVYHKLKLIKRRIRNKDFPFDEI